MHFCEQLLVHSMVPNMIETTKMSKSQFPPMESKDRVQGQK